MLCKAPWGAVPTHEQLQNQETEAGTPPVQGETAPPPSAPPTLQPILKSPSSPPRGRQKRLGEHPLPLHRGEPGAANVQAEHTRAGSSARGCVHRPLRRGADHARTVLPTPPPRAGRKSGGRRGRRSAEGAVGTSVACSSRRSRPLVGYDPRVATTPSIRGHRPL